MGVKDGPDFLISRATSASAFSDFNNYIEELVDFVQGD
jgi:hypothetical protein